MDAGVFYKKIDKFICNIKLTKKYLIVIKSDTVTKERI